MMNSCDVSLKQVLSRQQEKMQHKEELERQEKQANLRRRDFANRQQSAGSRSGSRSRDSRGRQHRAESDKDWVRFVTVCTYIVFVSAPAILLSYYYLAVWDPRYVNKYVNPHSGRMRANLTGAKETKTKIALSHYSAPLASFAGDSGSTEGIAPKVVSDLNDDTQRSRRDLHAAEHDASPSPTGITPAHAYRLQRGDPGEITS